MAVTAEQLDLLDQADLTALHRRMKWLEKARPKQIPPPHELYNIWLALTGRGWGKTRSLSQVGWWECWRLPNIIGHVVSPTKGDLKTTMFEGPAGLLSCIPNECLLGGTREIGYNKTDHTITFSNASVLKGFGATDDGGALRGPQGHFALCDEIARWDRPAGNLKAAFHNTALGIRLPYPDGTPSRLYLGSTPKGIQFIRELLARPDVWVVRGTTHENLDNLAENFKAEILSLQGTALGRQEVEGEVIDLEDIGIFRRSWFQLWSAQRRLPEFNFVVISLDTAFEEKNYDAKKQERDPTACTVWGVFNLAQALPDEMKKRARTMQVPQYAIMLCDAWQDMIEFPELLEKAREMSKVRWGSPGRKADIMLIENQGAGRSLRQVMQRLGVPVVAFNVGKMSKTQRAHAVSPIVAQKMVYVPESKLPERKGMPRDWVEPMLDQLCSFAGKGSVEHDDFIDSTVQTLMYLHAKDFLVPKVRTKEDPDTVIERQQRAAQLERDREKGAVNPYAAALGPLLALGALLGSAIC